LQEVIKNNGKYLSRTMNVIGSISFLKFYLNGLIHNF